MRILIVDDCADMRAHLQAMFGEWGVESIGVGTLQEGIRHMAREYFEWVVLEYRLPDGFATDFARIMRSGDSKMVLFSEDKIVPGIRANAQGFGIERCFVKPDELYCLVYHIAIAMQEH